METANFESQNPIPDIQIPVLPSTPTPNKNIFKFLFFIFLGLFLVTLLFSTYLLVKIGIKDQNSKTRVENQITENITPTLIPTIVTDETQNWQTYDNEEFNFKYPSNWNIENESINQDNPSNILRIKLIPQKQESCAESPAGNGVMCLDDILISLDKNKDELNRVTSNSNDPEESRNLIITKGEKGDIYKFDMANYYDGADYKTVCYVFDDGKVLWIIGSYLSKSEEEIFNKITSSIKIN
ncbi:MAG: hypothetical protein PHN66_00800 [Candidatus Shapirobacteria bacterium]|nr:hypothetical protein [Candidatus Shapirobacteria bacterium]